jgi:hypothetical protein
MIKKGELNIESEDSGVGRVAWPHGAKSIAECASDLCETTLLEASAPSCAPNSSSLSATIGDLGVLAVNLS